MSSRGSALVDFFMTRAWAMHEPVLQELAHVVFRHAEGGRAEASEIAEIVARRDREHASAIEDYAVHGDTAVIPITGVIAKHASMVNGSSKPRGTAVETISAQLKAALADNDVKRILFAVDSPGGAVDGVAALGDEIFAARGKKPMTALADGTMASAAYWLASQADKVYATKDAVVGSVGVYAVVADKSRQTKNEGIDVSLVRSGKLKGGGAAGTPITSDHLDNLEGIVKGFGEFFSGAVARGRAMSPEAVASIADGRVWFGEQARSAGLIDGVASMAGLLSGGVASAPARVAATVTLQKGTSVGTTEALMNQIEHALKSATDQGPGRAAVDASVLETNPMAEQTSVAPAVQAGITRDSLPPQLAQDLRAEGAQAERNRSSAIRALGASGQQALVEALVNDGSSVEAARQKLHDDLRAVHETRLEALKRAAPPSAGNDDRELVKVTEQPVGKLTSADYAAKAKAAFAKDPNLAREFGDEKTYAGWLEATKQGAVKGLGMGLNNLPRSV